jgi:lysozyme
MTTAGREALRLQLIRHEGMRLRPYRDSVGLLTIGVGRNLDQVGVTRDEAIYLLEHDIDTAVRACVEKFPWFAALDEVRQRAVVDLCFNMGVTKLLTFTNTLTCFETGDYDAAADNLMLSRWYSQVGTRGPRIVGMVRTGEAPEDT